MIFVKNMKSFLSSFFDKINLKKVFGVRCSSFKKRIFKL